MWSVYILYSALIFVVVLVYQILAMDILEEDLKFLTKIIPKFLIDTVHIIGLQDYSTLTTMTLAVKFIPFAINFCFGIYAHRQMMENANEINRINTNSTKRREMIEIKLVTDSESFAEVVFGTDINKAYFAFKCRKCWWVIDFL